MPEHTTVRSPQADLDVLLACGRAGAIIASVAVAAFVLSRGLPIPPEETAWQFVAHYLFLVVAVLGSLVALHSRFGGGVLLVFTGLALGVATVARYSQETALVAALLFLVPGSLLLIHVCIERAMPWRLVLLAAVPALVVFAAYQAREVHRHVYGPAHPQSVLQEQPYDLLEWVWSGAVTSDSATVNARVSDEGAGSARLVLSADPGLDAPLYAAPVPVQSEHDGVVSFTVAGLEPSTTYYYAVEVDGEVDTSQTASFQTFPVGPAAFSIVASSCARTGSNGLVFEAMLTEDPLLYVIPGDFHYQNIIENDLGAFREAYNAQLTAPAQAALYRQTPIAYVWDDHDFGGSDSEGSSPASPAARLAYRENVPHYELPAGEGNAPIYQAFTIGSVRFVMTDTRSMRDLEDMPDGSDSLLGAEQREWLKSELLNGSREHDLVVWVSSVPWIAPADDGRDDWGGYATERAEIAGFIAQHGISNLMMIAGDAHMLAIDDGANTDYSTNGGASFPIVQAAALDRPGSTKGGPYSEGAYPGAGQYALITFHPTPEGLTVEISGRNWLREEQVSHTFTVPTPTSVSLAPHR